MDTFMDNQDQKTKPKSSGGGEHQNEKKRFEKHDGRVAGKKKLHYVLAAWEGCAPDLKVLNSALTRRNKLEVFQSLNFCNTYLIVMSSTCNRAGKYFLVDFKYENIPGFIAPYAVAPYGLLEHENSWMNRQCSWMPEMMTNADSQMMAADVPFDIQQIEVKVLYDAVSVQILSSANNIHVVENNSVAQLLHYAITSDGHLQCCAARLPSNHQYVNVPIPAESLCTKKLKHRDNGEKAAEGTVVYTCDAEGNKSRSQE
nr:hypothetical protein [Tanacetum cinerariifolium]